MYPSKYASMHAFALLFPFLVLSRIPFVHPQTPELRMKISTHVVCCHMYTLRHARTHTHIYEHIRMHAYTHACTLSRPHTHIQNCGISSRQKHTCTKETHTYDTHSLSLSFTHTHTYTHTYVRVHTHTHTYICVHTCRTSGPQIEKPRCAACAVRTDRQHFCPFS